MTLPAHKLKKIVQPQSVSLLLTQDGYFVPAVAEASAVELEGRAFWYVNRVNVPAKLRGVGYGKFLVETLIQECLKSQEMPIVVTPGGYQNDYADLKGFYAKCGFVEVEPGVMEYP